MKHLKSLIIHDMKFQFRQGFYTVYLIVASLYIFLLKLLSPKVAAVASPLIVFTDPSFLGFFFIGAILFFESEQRVTEALFVTPVSKSEYLLSKAISLTIISFIVVLIIVLPVHGIFINWIYLLLGVGLTSILFIYLGILLSSYINSITTYLILGGLLLSPFALPVVSYLGLHASRFYYVIPTTGSIKLISGAINGGLTPGDFAYSVLYLLILIIIFYKILRNREL